MLQAVKKTPRRRRTWARGVPPAPQALPPVDWKEVKRLCLEEGLGPIEIARRLGCSYVAVNKAMRTHGIRVRRSQRLREKRPRELYRLWQRTRKRSKEKGRSGREIGMCAQWMDFAAFREWALANGYSRGKSIVLVRPSRGYSPGNCRFTTRTELARRGLAEKSDVAKVRAFGETKTVGAWSRDPRCRVSEHALRRRLLAAWHPEEAMTLPKGRTSGTRHLRQPVLRKTGRSRVTGIDWKAVEREWLESRTPEEDIARRLGVTRGTVMFRLRPTRAWLAASKPALSSTDRGALRRSWSLMMGKCRSPTHRQYHRAGALGIDVCKAWEDRDNFFRWALAAGWRRGMWLSRRYHGRGFDPSNCIWLDGKAARGRTRPTSLKSRPRWPITAFGQTRSAMSWSRDRRCKVSYETLRKRLHRGWDAEQAICDPPSQSVFGRGNTTTAVRAFGCVKHLAAWARDPRCSVTAATIRSRLGRGLPAEEAITAAAHQLDLRPRRASGKA
jgi:transposase-like protein